MPGYRFYYDKDLNWFLNEGESLFRAKRRVRQAANLFSRDMRKKIITKKSSCLFCGSVENLTIDHIIPISKGGKNLESNVQILCGTCNSKKGDRL